jgi:hypothetical protein
MAILCSEFRSGRWVPGLTLLCVMLLLAGCGANGTAAHSTRHQRSGRYANYLTAATVVRRLNTLLPNAKFTALKGAPPDHTMVAPKYGNYGEMAVVVLKRGYVFPTHPEPGKVVVGSTVRVGWVAPPGRHGYCRALKAYPPNIAVDFFVAAANKKSCAVPHTQHWAITDQALRQVVHPTRNPHYLSTATVLKQLNTQMPGEDFKVTHTWTTETKIQPSYQTYGTFIVYVIKPGPLPGALVVGHQPITTSIHVGNYTPYSSNLGGGFCDAVKLYPPNLVVDFFVNAPNPTHCRVPHTQQWQRIDQALHQTADLVQARRSGQVA